MPVVIVFAELVPLLQSLPADTPLLDLQDHVWSIGDEEVAKFVPNPTQWPPGWSLECEREEIALTVQEWREALGPDAMIADVLKQLENRA